MTVTETLRRRIDAFVEMRDAYINHRDYSRFDELSGKIDALRSKLYKAELQEWIDAI